MQQQTLIKSTVFLAGLLASAFACAQPYGYVVNSDGYEVPDEQIDNLYRINLATGDAERLGPTGFLDIEGLAFSPNGDLLGADDESNSLLVIDQHSGLATAVEGLSGNLRLPATQVLDFGLAYTCNHLYASSDNLSTLYRLNRETGEASLIGNTGVAITGLASYNNTLYGIGAGESAPALYRINTDNGSAELIGMLGGAVAAYVDAGLDFDADGRLWAITDRRNVNGGNNPSQILEIDPETGIATLVAETLVGIEGMAIAPPGGCGTNGGGGMLPPTAVPALSLGGLISAGLLLLLSGLILLRRRA
ncbi:MAG: hypothetical protein Tsb002_05110 [Wenzhouxiangellaceae bacterium]